MKKALVIGFGVSGKASAALLQKQGWSVTAVDRNARSMEGGSVRLVTEDEPLALETFSLVVISPGIPPTHRVVQAAKTANIEIIGEIELAFRYVENRCVGVTGTNGKTTATMLIAHALNAAGLPARAVGNIGFALSDYLLNPNPSEILIVELSSFQLETLTQKKLDCAVYLNLTPDHLDRYNTLRDYAAAKARIQECLKPNGKVFLSKQVKTDFGDLFDPNKTVVFEEPVAPISSVRYTQSGMPEAQNVEASYAVCATFGISRAAFDQSLKSFKKPAHRIEWLGEMDGVHYYDDSKGTNIDAVMHAVALFSGPIVLILGGVDKGASYAPWIAALRGKVRMMVAYGQAAEKMETELKGHFPFVRVGPFAEAVRRAKQEAKRGDTVLLSPGCSSFDQHKNYAHRGEEFKHLVMK